VGAAVVLQAVLWRKIGVNRYQQALESSDAGHICISGYKHSEVYQCYIITCCGQNHNNNKNYKKLQSPTVVYVM
jgi:hypothetical protein